MFAKILSCLEETNPSETNELYEDVIRLVAKSHVINAGLESTDDDIEEQAEDWLNEVISETIPDHDLFQIVGERDLLESDSWDMTFSLTGEACEYAFEVDERLKNHYENYRFNDLEDEEALELIEDFYHSWRSNFLEAIYKHCSEVANSTQAIIVNVEVLDDEYEPVVGAIVEMATEDGSILSTGSETDKNGKIQFVLEDFGDETVHALIYLNGSSQGQFEFSSGDECDIELKG